jgi:predicted tellurium resistance membrane protein TerC
MSRRPRRLRWGLPQAPPPRRPLRDSALLYGVFAVVVVLFAIVTGGSVVRAVVIAFVFFLVALAWTAWRVRVRARSGR